jgi:hypothetical protein
LKWVRIIQQYKSDAYSPVLELTMETICRRNQHNHLKQKRLYNFLKRMDKYSIWLDSAMVYMKKRNRKGMCTKSVDCEDDSGLQICLLLISKIICFTSIKLMPPFSEETKKDLTAKYMQNQ